MLAKLFFDPSRAPLAFTRMFSSFIDADKVAFIGLGNMGLPMSLNLKKEYPHILVYDNSEGARQRASSHKLAVAESTEAIARSKCEICFTMLPSDAALHDTMTILQESSTTLRMIVDCSTVSPSTSRYWQELWKSHNGSVFIDAPVSGGVKGAIDGTLTFMAGCEDPSSLDIAKKYLNIMGKRVVACGGPSAGSSTKLCNNLALATQMIGICEAMSLGEALNVDPVVLADVMNTSTAKCWSSEVNNPHPAVAISKVVDGKGPPASNDYNGGFTVQLMLKDLSLAVAAAEATGMAVPLTAASKELYRMAMARGLGDKDFGIILPFLKGR
jgi:3-hydroxyisobutyrate dehydrogenase